MSAEFIPGQNARAIRDTRSESGAEVVKNAQVTVEAYFGGSQFMARLEGETDLIFYTADFEPVEPPSPYPATPAPLDPSKSLSFEGYKAPITALDPTAVRAGDMVTLEKGTAKHIDRVDDVDQYQDGDYRFKSATSPTHVYRVGEGAWTLTAHQPAPEPEPAYEPRRVYEHPNGDRFWSVNTEHGVRFVNEYGDHFPPEDVTAPVRQLVVIDPATVDVDHLVDVGSETDDPRTNTLAILAGLGLGGAS